MRHFEGIEILNPAEKKFLACLEAVSGDNIWATAISNVMKAPTVLKIRTLISSLKSQAKDSQDVMLDILGQSCFAELENL